MARVSVNLSFPRTAEEAFNFYKSIFGGEFSRGGISRYSAMPVEIRTSPLDKKDENLIMHVELPIFKDYLLMGADYLESMDRKLIVGNNVQVSLEPNSKEEVDRLFSALSAGGKVIMKPMDAFR